MRWRSQSIARGRLRQHRWKKRLIKRYLYRHPQPVLSEGSPRTPANFVLVYVNPNGLTRVVALERSTGQHPRDHLCRVGALEPLEPVNNMVVAAHRLSVCGSMIGGIRETQEVLDFCASHQIGPDIQMIGMEEINDAYRRVENDDVRFRYVIDMASLKRKQ